ncbi:MAG: acyltransferase domain-containing protein [Waddliaceae bacterium]
MGTLQPQVIFLFSGQGSHYYQMGKEFMDTDAVFAHWMREGEKVLADLGYPSFLQILYGNPQSEPWMDLLFTHPCLVIIQYAMFRMLNSLGIKADAVLGVSVGEIAAAVSAGFCSFEEGIKISLKQAELIVEHCPQGGMTAVLGPPSLYWESTVLHDLVHFAGENFANHFMISGLLQSLKQAEKFLRSLNVNCQALPLSYAFHSSGIIKAKKPFESFCKNITPSTINPTTPLISGLRGKELKRLPDNYLWDVVFEPISFRQTIMQELEGEEEKFYVDLGPSGTLATFVKYNLNSETSQSKSIPLLTPFHNGEKNLSLLQKIIGQCR